MSKEDPVSAPEVVQAVILAPQTTLRSARTVVLPSPIVAAGEKAARRFVEFLTANIPNRNTRRAYAHALARFFDWCDGKGISLERLDAVAVAAYVEQLQGELSIPSVKQHLAAIRRLCDYLATGGVLPFNPAAAVRGPKHVSREGKTPVLSGEEARRLLESIKPKGAVALRDRALIGVMLYSFARVGAIVRMKVRDYASVGRRVTFRFREKGGRYAKVPGHHRAVEYVDAYLAEAGIAEDLAGPLFRAAWKKTGRLTQEPLSRGAVLRIIKRRARRAGLGADICNHSCRATGITAYLSNGGQLETAQRIAGHADPRTTRLYDRRGTDLNQDEIEKIRF